jgi:MFS transporter, PAT family, beta-lactamase induction signal transducer AmpG
MAKNSSSKLLILGSLYLSQYLPTSFLLQALPTFMRQQGASLETIGSLGFLVLPWTLKFLWSPLIDRFSLNRTRHYSTWILCFQVLFATCIAMCGLLDVRQNFPILMGFTLLACLLSASQDIATDALAVGMLAGSERAWGSTMQSAGNYLGSLIGGGVMLILLDRIGWRSSLLGMAVIILVAGIPLLKHQEGKLPRVKVKPSLTSLISFFKRDGMMSWVAILLIYSTGTSMVGAMMKPLLVDLKFTLVEIGQIVGIVSYSAGIVGALIGGTIVSRWGVERSLVLFGVFQGISVLACLPLARGMTDLPLVYAANISLQLFDSMGYTAIATVMLEKSQLATAATDYTIQSSLIYLSGILAMLVSGSLAEHFGYEGMLVVAAGVCILAVILVRDGIQTPKAKPPILEISNDLSNE